MPEICRFYGHRDQDILRRSHAAHFHAEYAEHEARIAIDSLAVISGKLPPRAMGLVAEWATLHQQELSGLWEKARRLEPLHRLDPLP